MPVKKENEVVQDEVVVNEQKEEKKEVANEKQEQKEEKKEEKKESVKGKVIADSVICVKKKNVGDCSVYLDKKQKTTLGELSDAFIISKKAFEMPENDTMRARVTSIKCKNINIY
jgi:hypothetical protein